MCLPGATDAKLDGFGPIYPPRACPQQSRVARSLIDQLPRVRSCYSFQQYDQSNASGLSMRMVPKTLLWAQLLLTRGEDRTREAHYTADQFFYEVET
ncbi:unnamed protein product [Mesocestoides corti]|uniref:Uncharacterized protein n=1 Tax=Mesocestoides corti TaxID=53468 RepID=A0A158QW90_MESCO|nr:unnamed protein product [Mesocestoides corti]